MNSSSSPSDIFQLTGQHFEVDCFARPSTEVNAGALRLQGEFYGSEGYRAVNAIKKSGFQLEKIRQFARVRWFGPFARTYVDDPTSGIPFLSSSDMMYAKLEPRNYLSKALTNNLERLLVSDGTILISRSGTIGNTIVCTSDYEGSAISEHAIRVNAKDDSYLGLLYTFFQSEPGQFLLTRNKSGSVIESIYEEDVASLSIPVVPSGLRKELTRLIKEACTLRVKANALLAEAELELIETCGLSDSKALSIINLSGLECETEIYSISSSMIGHEPKYPGAIRLDATSFSPFSRHARSCISKIKHDQLKNLAEDVIYIGKVFRNFIDDNDVGVPLLSGKDLTSFRLKNQKYLSKIDKKHIERCQLKQGWILISRSGNIGRVGICHRNYEGHVGSEDLLRIVPDNKKLDPYYLACFLSSKYGKAQIDALIYGSVITHISKEQFKTILIPIPEDLGASVGAKVRSSYEFKANALSCEDKAIKLFMTAIHEGKAKTESIWGRDY